MSRNARCIDAETAKWILETTDTARPMAHNPSLGDEAVEAIARWCVDKLTAERKGDVYEAVATLKILRTKGRLAPTHPAMDALLSVIRGDIEDREFSAAEVELAYIVLHRDPRVNADDLVRAASAIWVSAEKSTLCDMLRSPAMTENAWWEFYGRAANSHHFSRLQDIAEVLAASRFARNPKAKEALLRLANEDSVREPARYLSAVLPAIAKGLAPTEFRELVTRYMEIVPDTVARIVSMATVPQCKALSPADLTSLFCCVTPSAKGDLLTRLHQVAPKDPPVARDDRARRAGTGRKTRQIR